MLIHSDNWSISVLDGTDRIIMALNTLFSHFSAANKTYISLPLQIATHKQPLRLGINTDFLIQFDSDSQALNLIQN